MQIIRNACLVGANTANLDRIRCVRGPSLCKSRADQANDMVSAGENEISDQTFVSIDNEVASEFLRFFVFLDKLGRRQGAKVTSNGLDVGVSSFRVRRDLYAP